MSIELPDTVADSVADRVADSVAGDVEEETDKTDVADASPPTAEPDA